MSPPIRRWLVILSVALNAAFIAAWGVHRIPGGLRCPLRRVHHAGGKEVSCPLHAWLGSTDVQRREIEESLQRFRASSRPLCAEINRHRLELIDLLAAPQLDRSAIHAKQEQILAGQRGMQERVIQHLLDMKGSLAPDQREVLFRMLRERSDCAGHGPMMLGAGGSPTGPK